MDFLYPQSEGYHANANAIQIPHIKLASLFSGFLEKKNILNLNLGQSDETKQKVFLKKEKKQNKTLDRWF